MFSPQLSTKIPQKTRYFVILVHFGASGTTDRALKSLLTADKKPDKIIVIDHSPALYKAEKSFERDISLIRPAENSGYAAGVNIGLGVLLSWGINAGDIIIVMNNDVVVQADTLAIIEKWTHTSSTDSLVGVGSPAYVNMFTGRAIPTGNKTGFPYLPYIHGAFFLAPYSVFLKLKGLPDEYFLYWEDVAFSWRAQTAGIPLTVIPDIAVSHSSDADVQPLAAAKEYYLIRNGAYVLEHEAPGLWKQWWWVWNRLRELYHGQSAVGRALRDARKGKLGPASITPSPASGGDSPLLRGSKMTGIFPLLSKEGNASSKSELGEVFKRERSSQTSAIVVTHNSAQTIAACVASLLKNNIQKIVIVDNASTDKTQIVTQQHADVKLVALRQNRGFATAANMGAKAITTPYFLFLNPDAVLPKNTVAKAEQYLDKQPDVAVAGFLLQDEHGQPEATSFGATVGLWTLLTRHLQTKTIPTSPALVDWTSAGAMLVRREIFEQLNGFDESFFLYWEDVDLCQRVGQKGYKVVLLPDIRVTHQRGSSSSSLQEKTKHYDASADRYFCKHYAQMICHLQRLLRRLYRYWSPVAW